MKLVLVHSNVTENEILNSFNTDCVIRKVNDYTTVTDLKNSITTNNFTHLAFIYHFEGMFELPFYNNLTNNTYNFVNDNLIDLINFVKSGNSSVIVDILTCNLNDPTFISEIQQIETDLSIDIRYSLDQTGNDPNGDWVLESDNVDIKSVYFTTDIDNWTGVLYTTHYNYSGGYYGPIYDVNGNRIYLHTDINGDPINPLFDDGYNNLQYSDSQAVSWGNSSYGGDFSGVTSDIQSGVIYVGSTISAYAAIKSDGSVIVWGNTGEGGDATTPSDVTSSLTSGVTSIYSTRTAFAALKSDGSVVTWGNSSNGGNSTTLYGGNISSGVSNIFSTINAFAALKSDGSVVTWGSTGGGNSTTVYGGNLSSNVVSITATNTAFAALKSDGSVVTWGNANAGGNHTDATYGISALGGSGNISSNVVAVYANEQSFAALKSDGSVVTWGLTANGGDSSTLYGGGTPSLSSGVSKIYSSQGAFAALKSDGSVVTWGSTTYGSDSSGVSGSLGSGVSTIYSNTNAFAALKSDGSVVTWGNSGNGGNSSSPNGGTLSSVVAIYSTNTAFAALKSDGTVITWGDSNNGGNGGSISNVATIYSTLSAFAALHTDGSTTLWGSTANGADATTPSDVTTEISTDVVTVYSNYYSFTALINPDDTAGEIPSGNTVAGVSYGALPCFLKGTNILTVNGYKLIEEITENDLLINDNGTITQILDVTSFKVLENDNNRPYKVPKGKYQAIDDLYLSKNHCLKVKNYFIPVSQLKGIKQITSDEKEFTYYHITTENIFTDAIIANGVSCETYYDIKNLTAEDLIRMNTLLNKKFNIRLVEGKERDISTVLPYLKKGIRKYLK